MNFLQCRPLWNSLIGFVENIVTKYLWYPTGYMWFRQIRHSMDLGRITTCPPFDKLLQARRLQRKKWMHQSTRIFSCKTKGNLTDFFSSNPNCSLKRPGLVSFPRWIKKQQRRYGRISFLANSNIKYVNRMWTTDGQTDILQSISPNCFAIRLNIPKFAALSFHRVHIKTGTHNTL